jgi:peroxiredoxin
MGYRPPMGDPDFHASSSRGKALSLADFQGKVPVVLAFVGPLEPDGPVVADFDRHHVDFGRERVQLLVVAEADGPDVRAVPFSGHDLPVLADPHNELRASFAEGQQGDFAVILDKQGRRVEAVGLSGGAEALLAKVRDLGAPLHA